MGKQLMVAGETHEFLEKLNTTKSLWQKNLPTEELLGTELLAEMEKKLDCKAWRDELGD
jgi:hypothetical protein